MILHEALAAKVAAWRIVGYACEDHPAIAEILEWARGTKDSGNERFLRAPQFKALETYWYLRLIEKTPHILDLYRRCFKGRDLLEALGLNHEDLKDKATPPRSMAVGLNNRPTPSSDRRAEAQA